MNTRDTINANLRSYTLDLDGIDDYAEQAEAETPCGPRSEEMQNETTLPKETMPEKPETEHGSGSPFCSLALSGPLVEFVDDVTAQPVAVRPEHIDSMSRYKFKGLTMIKTQLGFFLAREPDYCSLVSHWRELLALLRRTLHQ